MSKFRKVDPRVWLDAKFTALSDDGKLAFLMLLTHPGMTAVGAIRGSVAALADDLGWPPERLAKPFRELSVKGMAKHDAKARLTVLPNFLKHNTPENPNVMKAWIGGLDDLPECSLKSDVIAALYRYAVERGDSFAQPLRNRFGNRLPNRMRNQEQEQEPEQTYPSQEEGLARSKVVGLHTRGAS